VLCQVSNGDRYLKGRLGDQRVARGALSRGGTRIIVMRVGLKLLEAKW
jgi:hypothetical protein